MNMFKNQIHTVMSAFPPVVEAGTPVHGNDEVERHLVLVEKVAYSKGLPPEAISVMLEFAMSLRMGTVLCARVLRCLIPATVVPQEAVVRAVVWLGVGKIPMSTQVLFIKWVLTMFDMIDGKDQLRAIYGFIFSFVTEENLCPFICHLLYLLTRKESGKSFSHLRYGPFIQRFPQFYSYSLFLVFSSLLQALLTASFFPSLYFLNVFPVSYFYLHQLPAQMGSLLGSSLALQYLDFVQDESALLRLNFWLGYALYEEFLFCGDGGGFQNSDEALQFLNKLLSTENFLQGGFTSSEAFLYKFLTVWDGSLLRPQILALLSNIPVVPSSQIGRLLFEPLMQLFFTSSVFFKVGFPFCLTLCSALCPRNMTLSGFKDSVMDLVHFVGQLASVGLQLEGCHSLLLSFTLDFYETVCDMFLKYGLPLVVMPPPGVFYPTLFATDPISVDRLAYIMYRYKVNLASAKSQEKLTEAFHISSQTFHEFNHYVVVMVNSLWNSRMFKPDMDLKLSEELLLKSSVPQHWTSFDLIHHPAFMSYAIDFHQKVSVDRFG
uniref:Centromere protein I n=1 Tax=Sparus aurata TaxID=8175 RepID=A0A671W7G2_SPAAU